MFFFSEFEIGLIKLKFNFVLDVEDVVLWVIGWGKGCEVNYGGVVGFNGRVEVFSEVFVVVVVNYNDCGIDWVWFVVNFGVDVKLSRDDGDDGVDVGY